MKVKISLEAFNIKRINNSSLTQFLSLIFDDLSTRISHSSFISQKAFSSFYQLPSSLSQRIIPSAQITKEKFITSLIELYCGSFESKLKFFFEFLDIDSDGKIKLYDIKTILYQYHLLLTDSNFDILDKIIINFDFGSLSYKEFVDYITKKNCDLYILLCFFFYKTKPFKNHFLNLFFDRAQGTNDAKETNQYEISSVLKEYMKLLSYKYREQYEDSKMSMNDDQSLSLKKNLFDEKDEEKLKHNLIYQHRSSTNIIRCNLSLIERIHINTANNNHITENASTQCDEIDTDVSVASNSKTISAYINKEKVNIELYENYIMILSNDGSIKELIDLRYSYIDYDSNSIRIGTKLSFNESMQICFEHPVHYKSFFDTLNSYDMINTVEDKYEIKEVIGKGGYGTVYSCEGKGDHVIYAMKQIDKEKISKSEQCYITDEIKVLSLLKNANHKNIIKPIDFYENDKYLYVIFEYLPLGTISNFISENEINYDFIKSVSSQLQSAILFLNKCGIVHRDIKLDNILCMRDSACNVNIKLIDFGFGTFIYRDQKLNAAVGTLNFLAPEIVNRDEYDYKVDVWSFGVILYYLRYGVLPFDDERVSVVYQNIRMGRIRFGCDKYNFSEEEDIRYKKVIAKCLVREQKRRASIEEVGKEEWFGI